MDFRLPDVLDPDYVEVNVRRVPGDHQVVSSPELTLEERFRKACEYGQALWYTLAEARRYLRDDVGGGSNGEDTATTGTPLLTDEASWRHWAELYAGVCSALAGLSGDNGFGRSEATLMARSNGVDLRRPPA